MIEYLTGIASLICIFSLLHQGYNLILGYGGMLHVGHVAFFAIGAYVSALTTTQLGVPVSIGILLGIAGAFAAGFLLALPTVRFRDDYIVAATLAMGETVRLVITNERELTGGSFGVTKIPRPEIFGVPLETQLGMFVFIVLITVVVMLGIRRILKTPYGLSLESIREDEVASEAIGYNTWLKKIQILSLGAAIAGLSGALFAHHVKFIDPSSFTLDRMVLVLLAVMLGGKGTFWGPIVSTVLIVLLYEGIQFMPIPGHQKGPLGWIIFSLLLIAILIYKPRGISGERKSI